MIHRRRLTLTPSTLAFPLLFALIMWGVLWFELKYSVNFNSWGIKPRTTIGLRGIIFAPFIHGGVSHALNNTLPIIILGTALFYFYREIALKVLILGLLLTGVLTWVIAREGSTHIGASGVVYLMFSFLFFKGIWSKNFRLIALSLTVAFAYGSMVWGVFPGEPHISWEGHLSGFVSGLVFTWIYRKYTVEPYYEPHVPSPAISKREAEFLSHFDEEGNFVPASEWKKRREEEERNMTLDDVEIQYVFKSSKEEGQSES